MSKNGEPFWYMSRDEKNAFTTDPEQAVTVKFRGADSPVLAPGYVNAWARTTHARQLQIWEALLDTMEKNYELERGTEAYEEAGGLEEEMFRNVRINAIEDCLAMLSYGEINENTRKLIQKQAEYRYEQETE